MAAWTFCQITLASCSYDCSFDKCWPISTIFGTQYTVLMCNETVIYLFNSPTYCCYNTLGNIGCSIKGLTEPHRGFPAVFHNLLEVSEASLVSWRLLIMLVYSAAYWAYNMILGQIVRSIDRIDWVYCNRPAGRPAAAAGFCHPMRLSDFIDFISVQREREDRRRTRCQHLLTTTHCLSQLEASDRGTMSANVGGRNRINLRIRESANPQINKC